MDAEAVHLFMSFSPTILTLTVSDLSRGGAGLARDETGRVVFIPFTVPGDRVKVCITQTEKKYLQAEVLEILSPSPLRVKPRCPAFGKCGGCQWQHLPYKTQWETKLEGVKHVFKKLQLDCPLPIVEFPAEKIWEYRNRVQLRGFQAELGFFAAKSHQIVPVNRCDIARPEINLIWEDIRKEGALLTRPYKIELEALTDGTVQKIWNAPHAASGFRQIHNEQNKKLRYWIQQTLPSRKILYDLFGGAGNLSLSLAKKMEEIHCVDVNAPTERLHIPAHFHFHRANVFSWLLRRLKQLTAPLPSSAILDPPREGLRNECLQINSILKKLGVQELIVVGCHTDSWTRDLVRFVSRGWVIEKVAVFDFFPHTPHVETAALLVSHMK